jgi:hypothetical protein
VNQIVKIPKGIRLPKVPNSKEPLPPAEVDIDTLRATVERYLDALDAGNLPATRTHPFFGPLDPATWCKFHVAHCGHHLRQFGLD